MHETSEQKVYEYVFQNFADEIRPDCLTCLSLPPSDQLSVSESQERRGKFEEG